MKIISLDRTTLMLVKEIDLAGGRLFVTGQVMGTMPMKGFIEPADVRALLRGLGLRKILTIAWSVLTARRKPDTKK